MAERIVLWSSSECHGQHLNFTIDDRESENQRIGVVNPWKRAGKHACLGLFK